MITTIRLSEALKDRLKACLGVFSSPKTSSDVLRLALDRGVENLLEDLEKTTKQVQPFDIRHLAQHYDFQEEFSFSQLRGLFHHFDSALSSGKSSFYLHPSMADNIIEMFLVIMEERHLKEQAFSEFQSRYWAESYFPDNETIDFYECLTKAAQGLRNIQGLWHSQPIKRDHQETVGQIYIMKSLASILKAITLNPEKYLTNFRVFQKSIYPYLKTVITIVKSELAKEGQSVCHYLDGRTFCVQNGIKESVTYHSNSNMMSCNILFSNYWGPSFSACLSFTNKHVLMLMSFDEFNDLLRFSALLCNEIDTLTGHAIEGRKLQLDLFHDNDSSYPRGSITIRGTPIYFYDQELKDLFTLFHDKIKKELSSQIEAYQYQFGGL